MARFGRCQFNNELGTDFVPGHAPIVAYEKRCANWCHASVLGGADEDWLLYDFVDDLTPDADPADVLLDIGV